jgi:class 3 adenylate cyclase
MQSTGSLERSLVPEYLQGIGREWVEKPTGAAKKKNGTVAGANLIAPHRENITCVVSILDVSGFTKLSEGLCSFGAHGADYLLNTLNEYFAALIDSVTSQGGDVLKFAGDALIITWRCDSEAAETQALRAIRASLNACLIQSSAIKHGHSLAASDASERRKVMEEGFDLKAHVGLAFGELAFQVLGGIGGRHEFLVSGNILKETGSALDAAGTSEVVVSPKLWKLVDTECKGTETTKSPGFFKIDSLTADESLFAVKKKVLFLSFPDRSFLPFLS